MTTGRRPSYGASVRVALLLLALADHPRGVPIDDVLELLGCSLRTVLRYLAALRSEVVDIEGQPRVVFRDGRVVLRPAIQESRAA